MNRFLRSPHLGGWLAIFNGTAWVALISASRLQTLPEPVLMTVGLILSFPIALPFFVPKTHAPTVEETIITCIAIGINSLAWGYGVAWLWYHVTISRSLRRLLYLMTVIAIGLGIWRLLIR
ncbi:MAG: hypothetical protein R3C05_04505 [Pirellulaceae bacterium]